MVFGNRSVGSGTGVLFTRNPATGEPSLYGDVMFNAQGEDVVAGTHAPEPVSILDERLPDVARELRDYAARLERHNRDLCDIEFTIEHGRLWMLQCRIGKRSPQAGAAHRRRHGRGRRVPAHPGGGRPARGRHPGGPTPSPPSAAMPVRPLATGLWASPGVACGEIVTSPDAAVEAAEAGRTVILVRAETSPDDVHGMAQAAWFLPPPAGSRAMPPSSREGGGSRPSSARPPWRSARGASRSGREPFDRGDDHHRRQHRRGLRVGRRQRHGGARGCHPAGLGAEELGIPIGAPELPLHRSTTRCPPAGRRLLPPRPA